MDGQGEKKEITYDTVDKFYLNNINTNMSIAEYAALSPIHDIKSKCESILTNNNSNHNFNILCLTLLSYFKLSTNPGSSKNPDNYCGYANYWLNNKVRKNNGELEEYASNFFEVFSSSAYIDFVGSECKKYIYNLGEDKFKKMNILFTYYNDYNKFLMNKMSKPDLSCTYAQNCATIYKDNIMKCSTLEDEFCTKLRDFKDTLMEQLKSLRICAAQQELILSIDRTMAESSSQKQSEESTPASTISASTFGTTMGVPLILLLLYKFTPFGSWLSPQIGNIKNRFNIADNEQNESLFNYSELNSSNEQYNVPYNIIGN
ncbi:PIR Superfamily Protein [Plasmodium ovale wallikeri]|uniref:PIR Superfamily Protein n=1 Tax=Plasmodium ovale wallikeri TaxID=864142 RepID=A0A1A9ALA7_PLAOA|nr:PIR Superfamily Protein [Plasmodium ovale wallikeri]